MTQAERQCGVRPAMRIKDGKRVSDLPYHNILVSERVERDNSERSGNLKGNVIVESIC